MNLIQSLPKLVKRSVKMVICAICSATEMEDTDTCVYDSSLRKKSCLFKYHGCKSAAYNREMPQALLLRKQYLCNRLWSGHEPSLLLISYMKT